MRGITFSRKASGRRGAMVLVAAMAAWGAGGAGCGSDGPTGLKVVLLQTNDIHSQLQGHDAVLDYTPATVGDDATVGGMSRLAARVKCAFDAQGLLNPGKVFPTLHRCAELGRVHVHGGKLAFPELPRF